MKIIRQIKEAVRFGFVGVGSTLFTYFIYFLLDDILNPSIAYVIGYVAGIIVNYIFNTLFTFKTNYSVKKVTWFLICHGMNLALSLALLNAFVFWGVPKDFAPIPMYAICIPINFFMVRYFLKK